MTLIIQKPTGAKLLFNSGNRPAAIAGVAPTLDYRFARDKREIESVSLTDKLTFTGGSERAFVGTDGLLRFPQTNETRFDHTPTSLESKGLLLEPERTNSFLQSQDFGNSYWNSNSDVTITKAAGAAPDGTMTANLVTPIAGTVNAKIGRNAAGTSTVNRVYSFFAKANGVRYITIGTSTSARNSCFDLVTGEFLGPSTNFVAPSSAVLYPNGWCRIAHTTATGAVPLVIPGTSFTRLSTGSTSTFNGTDGFFLWGAQWEDTQTAASSYIPTTTVTVTASANSAAIDGTGVITGTYTVVEKPVGCAVVSGASINLQTGYTVQRVMVFPVALSTQQIIDIREAM